MDFITGQKVLCIDDHYESFSRYPVTRGTVYTIAGQYRCPCGSHQVNLEEFPARTLMGCRCPRTSTRRSSYYSWRFVPLELLQNIRVFSSEKIELAEET